jgi:hypothetical protein
VVNAKFAPSIHLIFQRIAMNARFLSCSDYVRSIELSKYEKWQVSDVSQWKKKETNDFFLYFQEKVSRT